MLRNQDLRLLRLQAQKYRAKLFISIDGPLGQKGRRDSARIAELFRNQLAAATETFRWKLVPRARMAVRMTFHGCGPSDPSLQKLVKYYLDELREVVFQDDRQVSYLEANRWTGIREEAPRLVIEVERLESYKKKFDLFFEIADRFEDKVDYRRRNDFDPNDPIFRIDTSGFDPRHRKSFDRRRQEKLLSVNRIERFDRPGGIPNYLRGHGLEDVRTLLPFSINLGSLPGRGESANYKGQIRRNLVAFRDGSRIISNTSIPVALDIQVSAKARHVSKDLDNIAIDVLPIFTEEVATVDAFRIYVADSKLERLPNDGLHVKILPPHAVWEFDMLVDDTLREVREWIEDERN